MSDNPMSETERLECPECGHDRGFRQTVAPDVQGRIHAHCPRYGDAQMFQPESDTIGIWKTIVNAITGRDS